MGFQTFFLTLCAQNWLSDSEPTTVWCWFHSALPAQLHWPSPAATCRYLAAVNLLHAFILSTDLYYISYWSCFHIYVLITLHSVNQWSNKVKMQFLIQHSPETHSKASWSPLNIHHVTSYRLKNMDSSFTSLQFFLLLLIMTAVPCKDSFFRDFYESLQVLIKDKINKSWFIVGLQLWLIIIIRLFVGVNLMVQTRKWKRKYRPRWDNEWWTGTLLFSFIKLFDHICSQLGMKSLINEYCHLPGNYSEHSQLNLLLLTAFIVWKLFLDYKA